MITGSTVIAFIVGMIVATVVWYFVLRNNRKHINEFLDAPEKLFDDIWDDIEDLDDKAKEEFDELKEKLSSFVKKHKK